MSSIKSGSKKTIEQRIKKITPSKYAKDVLYGRSGTGKTTLACSYPAPVLLVDFKDNGEDSVADVEGVSLLKVQHWSEVSDLYWFLKKRRAFKTVIFDTVTQLQLLRLQAYAQEKKKKNARRIGDWGTMTKQDWGNVGADMKNTITDFRDLNMNVVFIAQEKVFAVDEDEQDDDVMISPEVGPLLSPAVKDHLNASCSRILNTFVRQRTFTVRDKKTRKKKEKKKIEYCLRIGPNSVYTTKMRKPKSIVLPEFIVDPTYDKIQQIMKGEYDG